MRTILIKQMRDMEEGCHAPLKEKLSHYVGGNTGNRVFVEALKEQVDYDDLSYDSPLLRQEECTAILGGSNFISAAADSAKVLGSYACYLEKHNVHFTIAGLGAQSTKLLDTPRKLVRAMPSSSKRSLKIISEHAVTLGIRGKFTAECLEQLKIQNYRIIGCPSAFTSLDGNIKKIKQASLKKTVFNITTGNSRDICVFNLGRKLNSSWIMQMDGEADLGHGSPWAFYNSVRMRVYQKKKGRIFFDLGEWKAFLEKNRFTFCFGSRFHGNMCSLQCGIPALWVVHDSRTAELVETLCLPSITYDLLEKVRRPERLLGYCNYERFYQNYFRLTEEYVRFLDENHIRHHFKLNKGLASKQGRTEDVGGNDG